MKVYRKDVRGRGGGKNLAGFVNESFFLILNSFFLRTIDLFFFLTNNRHNTTKKNVTDETRKNIALVYE